MLFEEIQAVLFLRMRTVNTKGACDMLLLLFYLACENALLLIKTTPFHSLTMTRERERGRERGRERSREVERERERECVCVCVCVCE